MRRASIRRRARCTIAGPACKHVEETRADWLRADGPVRVGVTAGASTPNNKIGETVARILATRGLVLETV